MIEQSDDLWSRIAPVAAQSIHDCAQGILTEEALAEQILQEWKAIREGEDQPTHCLLVRIARRNCSRALCEAWRSPQPDMRNCAFDNLRRYLERLLSYSRYAATLRHFANATEDVVHQTLEELYTAQTRNAAAGPNDPAAFLMWARTAVIRHAHVFVQKNDRDHERCDSLDAQQELFAEQFVDEQNRDPQQHVSHVELQQALKDAILSLRNPRYQQVLLSTYLAGMDDSEVARRLHVQVQDVYMWRYRALKALRSKPEVMQVLQSWRE